MTILNGGFAAIFSVIRFGWVFFAVRFDFHLLEVLVSKFLEVQPRKTISSMKSSMGVIEVNRYRILAYEFFGRNPLYLFDEMPK